MKPKRILSIRISEGNKSNLLKLKKQSAVGDHVHVPEVGHLIEFSKKERTHTQTHNFCKKTKKGKKIKEIIVKKKLQF